MKRHFFTGRGKNALKKLFLQKTLAIVNSELELFKLKIQYPSPFQNRNNNLPSSPLYLTDETFLVEIMELVSGLFLIKRVVTHTGKESPLAEIGRTFEWLFNIKLGDIHKKHENVICRKANKRTEFLDLLRKVIIEESEKKGYL
ncbi:RteC domain-containing protein [Parabacteroides hominis]|uniref:RteC domain-containing protein n=1 Tax=Parabacteroides hominis TaxID=2763057 RepID=UPI002102027E|nr:RteC domain-containing protein [Parabacteroides hominis]